MSIWFIILVTVLSDGKLTSSVVVPSSPKYNNEEACHEAGKYFMEKEQMKIGTNTGTVFFDCKEITAAEIKKATKGNNDL